MNNIQNGNSNGGHLPFVEAEEVNYIGGDTDNVGEKSEIARAASYIDQVPHQFIITEDGRNIDLDEKHFEIVEEDGRVKFDADGEVLVSIAKSELSYGNFIKTYRESSSRAMLILLCMQSNFAPLKKGGYDIGYMANILADHMIEGFGEEGNMVWEALCAIQSSRPEDNSFTLTADDIRPYTNYASEEALYHAFKRGCMQLKHNNLELDIPDPDTDGHNICIHWNDGIEWVGTNKKTGEKAHCDIYTNDFYRTLMCSSGIIPGTHWNRRITRSLKGYARALYKFCARNKRYTRYNGAIPGVKELNVEETRYELKISETEPRFIWRNLQNASEKINSLPNSEYQVVIRRLPIKGHISGFRFEIKENRIINSVKHPEIEEKNKGEEIEEDHSQELQEFIYSISENKRIPLTPAQIITLSKMGDIELVKANYEYVCNAREIKGQGGPMGYIVAAIKENYAGYGVNNKNHDNSSNSMKKNKEGDNKEGTYKPNSKNKFHNFEQREIDYQALEKELLSYN